MIAKALVSAAMALIAVGLAAPAGADSNPAQDFLAAVRATGIIGLDPAILADGYNVCWELWNQHGPASQVAAGMHKDFPQLTTDQVDHFIIAAYKNLCPVPGVYDWWAYGTG